MTEKRNKTRMPVRERMSLRNLFLPIATALLIAIAAIIVLIVLAAQRADHETRNASTQLASSMIGHLEQDLANLTGELGRGHNTAAALLLDPYPRWVERYLTGYVLPTYDVSGLLVVDEIDAIVFSLTRDGGTLDGFAEPAVLAALAPLIERTRASAMDVPESASGYVSDAAGRIWLAAASALTPEFPDAGRPRPVVIVLQSLDAARLEQIAGSYPLFGLRVTPADAPPEDPFLALSAPDGTAAAYLTWQPPRLGMALLITTLPATGGAFVLLGAFLLAFVRHVHREQARLDQREALIVLNQRLEDEMTARLGVEADLRAALEREKRLGRLKSRFVAMASHEFRTPLTTIAAASNLMLHYDNRMSDADKRKNLEEIQAEVRNMTDLLEDILLIGQGEADRIRFNPVALDIERFCSELVEKTEALNEFSHPIRFTPARDMGTVIADDKLLRHILTNLLSNAFKYSPAGEPISFKLSRVKGHIEFRVRGRGTGIPVDDQAHIFEAFHRAENAADIQGTGLGLTIAKKSVDLHGGTISVKSVEGEGATFTVTIPDQPAGEETDAPPAGTNTDDDPSATS